MEKVWRQYSAIKRENEVLFRAKAFDLSKTQAEIKSPRYFKFEKGER